MTWNVFGYYKRLIGPAVTMTLAVLAAAGTSWGQNESFKILASDAAAGDTFGFSVSIDGDTAILGAPKTDDNNSDNSGSAYILQQDSVDPSLWNEVTELHADFPFANDRFGTSVAISGDFAIVGAPLDDHGGLSNAGSAYIFYRNQGGNDQWGQVAHLTASDAAASDIFGLSVAIDGDVAIIGAPWDAFPFLIGAAYIFQRDSQGNWNETDILTASDGEPPDQFGVSVSISAETVIIGADREADNGTDAGAAYIFGYDGQDWVEEQKLTASDGQAFDDFGFSVSISGDLLVVGARNHDTLAALFSGAAYIFRILEGQWVQSVELTASDAVPFGLFGWWVTISGDVVIVGAPGHDDDGTNSGSAYVVWKEEPGQNGWGEVVKLTASDAAAEDQFGEAVTISGGIGIIGVRDDDDNGTSSGSAYVFDPICPCPWDLDNGGFVGAGDLLLLLADWGNPYGAADLLALLAAWGLCPCVEGAEPPSLQDELDDACLSPAHWADFLNKMQTGSSAEQENYICWLTHYFEDCNRCICIGASGCPGPDPFD